MLMSCFCLLQKQICSLNLPSVCLFSLSGTLFRSLGAFFSFLEQEVEEAGSYKAGRPQQPFSLPCHIAKTVSDAILKILRLIKLTNVNSCLVLVERVIKQTFTAGKRPAHVRFAY